MSAEQETFLAAYANRDRKLRRGWKAQVQDACRRIIASTPDGTRITGDCALFVAAILSRHPDALSKAGCGIAGFTTSTDPRYRTGRHFVIIRTDGSTTDFSWKEAIAPSSRDQKLRDAMRTAIEPQVIAFRHSQPFMACALNAGHRGPYHVDHDNPSFQDLADTFASSLGGYGNLTLLPHRDGDTTERLGPDEHDAWIRYHQDRASLRMLCQPCNCNRRA